jgi:arylsulfatase A-like enzyme
VGLRPGRTDPRFGNRGVYHRGWSAVTKHRTPWQTTGDVGIAFDDDAWELYDGTSDWTQADDVSGEQPGKLHELQRLFLIEATRYNVLPLNDRSFERSFPRSARSRRWSGTSRPCTPA